MSLCIVCGPMFAGKSTTLYRYVERALRAKKVVDVVIPKMDKDANGHGGRTHAGRSIESLGVTPRWVATSHEVYTGLPNPRPHLLVIDETHFFDMELPMWIEKILDTDPDLHIVAAGLDMTSEGKPFGPMGNLLCNARKTRKLKAICSCGMKATRTAYFARKTGDVVVGVDDYAPMCLRCWQKYRRESYI